MFWQEEQDLADRIDYILAAFTAARFELDAHSRRLVPEFKSSVETLIDRYESHSDVRNRAQSDIATFWQRQISALETDMRQRLHSIVREQDDWMHQYFEPRVSASQSEYAAKWYHTAASA